MALDSQDPAKEVAHGRIRGIPARRNTASAATKDLNSSRQYFQTIEASSEAHVPSAGLNCPRTDFARLFYTFAQWHGICDSADYLSDFHFSLLASLSALRHNNKILPMYSALTLLVQ